MSENKAEANSLVIPLKKPYSFEGKEYTEIDLSNLGKWTCNDSVAAQKEFKRLNAENLSTIDAVSIESNIEYCFYVASLSSNLPIEFFKGLPAKITNKLKNTINAFFNLSKNGGKAGSLIITFEEPYKFNGKSYSEIDLSDFDKWTCDDVIEVQRKFKRINIDSLSMTDSVTIEGNLEYGIYAASKATRLPIEFFTNLPAKEANKIKNTVTVFFNVEA